MNFNTYSQLEGKHSFLSPSKGAWVNYSEDRLFEVFESEKAKAHGTRLHAFAEESILLGVRLRGANTLAAFVNDAIGFKMTPEQILYYSPYCFGSADAISFDAVKKTLRIHDLKTGATPAGFRQLEIYAALFCLEYKYKPHDLWICLRLYQNDEVREAIADPEVILHYMDRIKVSSAALEDQEELAQ